MPTRRARALARGSARLHWLIFLLCAHASLASAQERPPFQLPFACGMRVPLSTYAGHGDYEIDMIVPSGTPVLAVATGTAYRGYSNGGGYQVSILHANGWRSLYLHLTADSFQFADGASVQQGQHLANSGNTGANTGDTPHLHYEQQRQIDGDWTPVQAWFNGSPADITDDARENGYEDTSRNCAGAPAPALRRSAMAVWCASRAAPSR